MYLNYEIFIEDICKNIPLINAVKSKGKMVDWNEIDRIFLKNGVY
jgi:hypothetical protein